MVPVLFQHLFQYGQCPLRVIHPVLAIGDIEPGLDLVDEVSAIGIMGNGGLIKLDGFPELFLLIPDIAELQDQSCLVPVIPGLPGQGETPGGSVGPGRAMIEERGNS